MFRKKGQTILCKHFKMLHTTKPRYKRHFEDRSYVEVSHWRDCVGKTV